jgi:hypothetical protein
MDEPEGACVHNAGMPQDGQTLGSLGKRLARGAQALVKKGAEVVRLLSVRAEVFGNVAHDRENRSLARLSEGLSGSHGSVAHRDDETVDRHVDAVANPFAKPLEELREDDAGVALRAGERARGERRANCIERRKGSPQARDHGSHRRSKVRSRVSVGNGKDIDPIQVFTMSDDSLRASDDA